MTYQADITVNYSDGSFGAKCMSANSKESIDLESTAFVRNVIAVAKANDNEVTSYKVSIKQER